jgi:UDP-2-acetamido-2,6-beta-L-arabino-hexul-4-ose reductase
MKILVTGSKGFIGKNLITELKNKGYSNIYEYDTDSSEKDLNQYTKDCDFVFHLAGINRPNNQEEFMEGNFGFTSDLLSFLQKHNNVSPVMISSSVQAELNNAYGISKKAGEDLIFKYGRDHGVKSLVYRFPSVFGKWCKPNYNSVVATFSNNIANDLPITINDPNVNVKLIYIDDLVDELINALNGNETRVDEYCYVKPTYEVKLGKLAKLFYSFKQSRMDLSIPNMYDPLIKKLYSTYLSYYQINKLNYDLKMNVDKRGSFTEFIKTLNCGQVSINVSKPGITKGNHWHKSKNEKFLVVSGSGVIRFRKIGDEQVIEYFVNGDKLQVIDIPPGYIHNIENIGKSNLVTVMWANEAFDPENADTSYMEV